MKTLTSGDFFVYQVVLPYSVKGLTSQDEDGIYTIYINSLLSDAVKIAVLRHELEHINNNDFEKTDVQKIESDTHKRGKE